MGRPGVGGVEGWAEGSAASEGNVVRTRAAWAEQHGATAAGTQLIWLRAKLRPWTLEKLALPCESVPAGVGPLLFLRPLKSRQSCFGGR